MTVSPRLSLWWGEEVVSRKDRAQAWCSSTSFPRHHRESSSALRAPERCVVLAGDLSHRALPSGQRVCRWEGRPAPGRAPSHPRMEQ